jgi:integrase
MHVRACLTAQKELGVADASVHGFARGVKAMLRFFDDEGYIDKAPKFAMPKVSKERPKVLSPDDVKRLLLACRHGRNTERDKALVLVLLDTGVRRSELVNIRWGDVDLKSGTIRVRGKSAKARNFRTVIVSANTRRALLKFRRTVEHDVGDSLFGLTGTGARQVLRRLEERTGIHATPHDFRRTFTTLCLRDGMDVLTLQGLMGHVTLEMTRQYIRLVDEDLQRAHRKHGPVDRWLS